MISSNPAIFAVMARQKKIISVFHKAGATNSVNAIFPEEHGIHQRIIFRKLVRDGIIVQAYQGRYYLDELREKNVGKRRRDIIGIILMVIAIIVLIAFLWQTV